MTTLTDKKFVTVKKSDNLIEDFQGCGINTMITLVDMVAPNHKITIDELKKAFDYDADGISYKKYRFNSFNGILKANKIPYKVYPASFNSHQEILKELNNLPVPIFLSMRVIQFIREKFKYSSKNINFGDENDLFESPNQHILLLVGYEQSGQVLYFLDPVYQLPYYDPKDLSNKGKLATLNLQQFYECSKGIKSYISLRYIERLSKHFKKEDEKDKEKQETLK